MIIEGIDIGTLARAIENETGSALLSEMGERGLKDEVFRHAPLEFRLLPEECQGHVFQAVYDWIFNGPPPEDFQSALRHLINRFSKENGSDTPDFILAQYLIDCLDAFDVALMARTRWYER